MSGAEKEIRFSDGRVEHPGARYDRKDVRLGCVLALLVLAGCVLAIVSIVIWYVFRAEGAAQEGYKRSPYPQRPQAALPLPPEPRLEQVDRMENDPAANLTHGLAEMETFLHSSGTTAEKGFVHIPIEDAMKKIVGQLPVRKQPPDGSDIDRPPPGQSNSGRTVQGASP